MTKVHGGNQVGRTREDEKKAADAFFASLKTRASFPENREVVSEVAGGLEFRHNFYLCGEHEVLFFRNGMKVLGQLMVEAASASTDGQVQLDAKEVLDRVFKDHNFRRSFQELIGKKVADEAAAILLPVWPDHWAAKFLSALIAEPWRVIPREIKEEDFPMPDFKVKFVGKPKTNDAQASAEQGASGQ